MSNSSPIFLGTWILLINTTKSQMAQTIIFFWLFFSFPFPPLALHLSSLLIYKAQYENKPFNKEWGLPWNKILWVPYNLNVDNCECLGLKAYGILILSMWLNIRTMFHSYIIQYGRKEKCNLNKQEQLQSVNMIFKKYFSSHGDSDPQTKFKT